MTYRLEIPAAVQAVIDAGGLVAVNDSGGKAFAEGLSTAFLPWKATWQGASTGEGEMRDGWLRGWKAAEAEAREADDDIDDVETGSLIWGQSVGTPYG